MRDCRPESAAVTPPSNSRNHIQRGIDGRTPRGIRASHAAARIRPVTTPIGTQPRINVNSTPIPATTMSLVPAHRSWMTVRPGTGRSSTTGLRVWRRLVGAVTTHRLPLSGAVASAPSCRCRMRGHKSSSPVKSCEMTTTVSPALRRRSSSSRSSPRALAPSSPAKGSSRIRARGERASSAGQHDAAHLSAA